MNYPFDLGPYSRKISTDSAEAQAWFDYGLNWAYGFHQEEAIRCFERVIEQDPDCAMGYWGAAYVTGPYYNLSWDKFSPAALDVALKATHDYAQEALRRLDGASSAEKAICHALAARFPKTSSDDPSEFADWTDAYADAMRSVYADYPEDKDVITLTAEALMCRTPWKLWDLQNRVPSEGSDTLEAIEILETAMARADAAGETHHPGMLHMYVHLMEMSPEPERALAACDTLMSLVPDAGHMVHMPSHVYMLCGMYEEGYQSNALAGVADRNWVAYNDELGKYTIYRLHNVHFMVYAAMMLGDYKRSIDAADYMLAELPTERREYREAYVPTYLEAYGAMKPHIYIRFGKWQEIVDAEMPDDPEHYAYTMATWHYAKAVAYANLGDFDKALSHQAAFPVMVEAVPEDRRIFENFQRDILGVGEAMMAGEIAYHRGNHDLGYDHLRESVRRYDALNYTEPWPWMQPTRHALGALLLDQGHVDEAKAIYQADLGLDDTLLRPTQHPDNVWSLLGYVECLEKKGEVISAEIQQALDKAKAASDMDLSVSCFCRTNTDSCCS